MPPKKIINKKKPWNKNHIKNYSWLYSWFTKNYDDKANKEDFIDKNKRKLRSLIENNNKWSSSSKESLLFMVARYLFNKNNNDKYHMHFSQSGYNLLQEKEKLEKSNQMDNKEKENLKSIEYLNNCLEQHKNKENENIREHYKHLLLMMLIKQPPLRTSFYSSAKFLRLYTNNDKTTNYIYITKKGKLKIYYIVNHDKASNYKIYNMNKNLSKIKLENNELVEFIYNSFTKYPRNYLFEINQKPITEVTLLKYLRDITNTPLINFDMIRSAYVTNFYEDNKTFDTREKLALEMRHSVNTASKNYLKVSNEKPKTAEEQLINLNKIVIKLNSEVIEYKNKLLAYENNDEDIKKFNKRRNDIIYLLNNGKKSKTETINKYNIKYDDQTKKYN